MALEFDTSRAPRRASEYLQLVRAVRGATAADETDWLEWKSTLELRPPDRSDKSGLAHIARAVIGFANRMPDAAGRHVEGFGFLVVGVDPEGYHGMTEHDSVELEAWISPYVGDIDWSATYVRTGDEGQAVVAVLVVTVFPPQWGDPVRCMRKEVAAQGGKTIPEAAVFVRRRGSTDRAKATDIDRLCDRLARQPSGASLDVEITPVAGGLTPILLDPEELENWLDVVGGSFLDPLESSHNTYAGMPLHTLLDGLKSPDPRSKEEYRREINDYLAALRDAVPAAREQAAAVHAARLQLRLHNRTGTNLAGVRVELQLPPGLHAVLPTEDDTGEGSLPFGLPALPRLYGPVKSEISMLGLPHFSLPDSYSPVGEEPEIRPGPPVQVDFPAVHLRPQRGEDLHEIVLFSDDPRSEDEIVLSWQATSTHADGAAEGSVTVPVLPPVSLVDMIIDGLPDPDE